MPTSVIAVIDGETLKISMVRSFHTFRFTAALAHCRRERIRAIESSVRAGICVDKSGEHRQSRGDENNGSFHRNSRQ